MSNQYSNINQTLQGFYKVFVVNPTTQEVVWEQPDWQKNLILNNGMDGLYLRSVADSFAYAIAGNGTRINAKDGGSSTITQSANLIYLYGRAGNIADFTSSLDGINYPSVLEVGDVVQYANLSESKVVSVDAGGFMATVDTSYTLPVGDAQTFVVWKTSQTALQYELKRTNTYTPGASGTTTVGNKKTHRRVYDFSAEVGLVGYNELGFSWAAAGASTTFSRILLPSTVYVSSGYQLRVMYDLQTTFTPSQSFFKNVTIGGGWGTLAGSESIQAFGNATSYVDSSGNSNNNTAVLEPYWTNTGGYYLSAFVSSTSTPLAAFGSSIDRQSADVGYSVTGCSKTPQVLGTYTVDKTLTIPISNGNSTALRAIGLGTYGGGLYPAVAAYQALCYVFDTNKTKTSSQTVSFTYHFTWARVLS